MSSQLMAFIVVLLMAVGAPNGGMDAGPSGRLNDKKGDVTPSTLVPNPPDLIAARIERVDANLVITVSFAKGTLSPPTTLTIYLDTDENRSTGAQTFENDRQSIGADYVVRNLQPHDPAKAALTHDTGPGQQTFLGLLDVTMPSRDERQIIIPLARLGNDDGRLTFKVSCSFVTALTQGPSSSQMTVVGIDMMPDAGGKPGVVR